MDWFLPTLLATLAYGALQAVQRVASARGVAATSLLAWSATTVSLLAAAAAAADGTWPQVGARTVLLALLNGALFTAGTLALLAALRQASAATVLPVAKLDGLLVVLVGIAAFGERPSAAQALGIALGLGAVAALAGAGGGKSEGRQRALRPMALGAAAAACCACSMSVGKIAASSGPKLPFIAVSYAATAAVSLALARGFRPGEGGAARTAGIAVGVLNLAGYLLLLQAFACGPMVLIQPIFAGSMILAVLLAARALRERLTARQGAAMALSFAAAVVIRLGG